MAYDGRSGRHRLWVSANNVMWGSFLRSSDDFGRIWTNPLEANIRFPTESGASLRNIWQICLGRNDEPEKLYCGVEPAALFASGDDGESWSLVRGLYDHPHRPRWMPGNGGLILHTILPDPCNKDRMYVAVSAGGVYRTEEGGLRGWRVTMEFAWCSCRRNIQSSDSACIRLRYMNPGRSDCFCKTIWGLYRSDNRGDSWQDIAHGVPWDFGFAMLMHPHDADCVYIVPVESDEFRCTPEGHLRVYRTRNAGGSWEALGRGLPRRGRMKRYYEMLCRPIHLIKRGFTLEREVEKIYGIERMKEKVGRK